MKRLTQTQTDMLIAVGLDCVHHNLGTFGRTTTEDFFVSAPWFGPVKNICPNLSNATGTGRSLIRLGLIYAYADIPNPTAHRHAVLTDLGRERFEALLTPDLRKAMADQTVEADKMRRQDAERERKNAWLQKHHSTFVEFREREDERRNERQTLQRERDEIAMKIGRGANDTDDLLDRLRVVVRRLDALAAESEADTAAMPIYEAEEP